MESLKNEKLKIKILKDSKKDFSRKSKLKGLGDIKVQHSRFHAKGEFLGAKLDFREAHSHSNLEVSFPETKGMLPANRKEYGSDFTTADGKLMIMRFKMDTRGERVVTSIDILGGDGTKSKGGKNGRNKKE